MGTKVSCKATFDHQWRECCATAGGSRGGRGGAPLAGLPFAAAPEAVQRPEPVLACTGLQTRRRSLSTRQTPIMATTIMCITQSVSGEAEGGRQGWSGLVECVGAGAPSLMPATCRVSGGRTGRVDCWGWSAAGVVRSWAVRSGLGVVGAEAFLEWSVIALALSLHSSVGAVLLVIKQERRWPAHGPARWLHHWPAYLGIELEAALFV